jgi:hypothetical protein
LTGLASHLASDTLNSIAGLRNRLTTGCRHLAHQSSGLSQYFSSACLKTLEHFFALIELPFCRVADLCYRIGHDILNSPLVHRSPPTATTRVTRQLTNSRRAKMSAGKSGERVARA